MAPTYVYLLWLNDSVVDCFASRTAALAHAEEVRAAYPKGNWRFLTGDRWYSDRIARLEVDERRVLQGTGGK